MASNTTSTAAETANQPQQDCPFMKLPTELRLRIYEFAFGAIVDEIESDAANTKQLHQDTNNAWPLASQTEHQIFVGVLSFLHTSRELRHECVDAILAPTEAYKTICYQRYKNAGEAYRTPPRDEHGRNLDIRDFVRVHRLLRAEFRESLHRYHRAGFICDAIASVVLYTQSSARRELVRSKYLRDSMAVD